MKILRIESASFGALRIDQPVSFEPGLNLWLAKNQAGKTTLLTFLEWMLYGPPPRRGARDPEVLKRWTPWGGGKPEGRIVIQPELSGWPGEILVAAHLGDYLVQISEHGTQKTLVGRVTVSRSGEWDLGKQLLNLSRQSFRDSLAAFQGNVVNPLHRGNLRQILTSDLGALVENPDVATVDRILEALQQPTFTLGNSQALTVREQQHAVTKELDILELERTQLEQQLGEFRDAIGNRDAATAQLEQQERVTRNLDNQLNQLELARSYYMYRVSRPAVPRDQPAQQLAREHPEYLNITPELEREVDNLSGQLTAIERQLLHQQEDLAELQRRQQAEEDRLRRTDESSGAVASARQLREASTAVEHAHADYELAHVTCQRIAEQITERHRSRHAELDKRYAPHREHLSAITEWQKEHLAVEEELARLRQRRSELQILTRVHLPRTFYLGLVLVPLAALMPVLAVLLVPRLFSWTGWIAMGLILLVAVLFISPYWRLRRTSGPAANELRRKVVPAITEGTNQLGALDRRRRRFIELYELDRPTWDRLVDDVVEYTDLDRRMREYTAARRDEEAKHRSLNAAWLEVGQIVPLAPLTVDLPWLKRQLEDPEGASGALTQLSAMSTRIADLRQAIARLTEERSRFVQQIEERLTPVGFGAQVRQGAKDALELFRGIADQVRGLKRAEEQQAIIEVSAGALPLDEEEFERRWAALSEMEQGKLMSLASTREGYRSVCARLREVAEAREEAEILRDTLRNEADGLRDELTKFGRIDREAEDLKRRRADAVVRQAQIERWDKALKITTRIVDSLVNRASQDIAPEVDRALKKILSAAPIEGLREVRLGANLELSIEVEGAPASIPGHELWTHLSSGAQQQLALALRLAMARTASGRTNLPLLLDEPLAELDDERAQLVFRYVTKLAESTQIIIASCHRKLYEWLLQEHRRIAELEMPLGS